MKKVALLITLMFVALIMFNCESTDEDKPTYEELIKIGKHYLEKQDAVPAAGAFSEALELKPESLEAKYGLFLANIMQISNLFSNLLELLKTAEGLEDFGSGGPIGTYIQEFLQKVLEPKLAKNEELFFELSQQQSLLFDLKSYKLTIGEDVLLNWHGKFKLPELYFMAAINSLILAADHIACAHYLDFDMSKLAEFPQLSDDMLKALGEILDFVEKLMNDPNYPDFLYLKGYEGEVRMPAAGLLLGATWFRLIQAFESASNREARSDYPITYDDLDGNNIRNPEETLIIRGIPILAGLIDDLEGVPTDQRTDDVKLTGELVGILTDLFSIFGAAFLDTSAYDIFPDEPNPISLADFMPILVYFDIIPFPLPLMNMIKFYPGEFFAQPTPDGLRSLLEKLNDLYDLLSIFIN